MTDKARLSNEAERLEARAPEAEIRYAASISHTTQPEMPDGGEMVRTLVGIAMLSGFLVVLVFQLTKPFIEENQRRAVEQAVFQVLPGAVQRRDFLLTGKGLRPAEEGGDGIEIYPGYDTRGRLLGIAIRARAQGYADMIHLLYGVDPECRCIRGIKVLKLAETPGLGDKIITDPAFRANFNALDVSLDADGRALAHPIETVKHGKKQHPWQIDAISGATISSRAVGRALNESARETLPMLWPRLNQLRTTPAAMEVAEGDTPPSTPTKGDK